MKTRFIVFLILICLGSVSHASENGIRAGWQIAATYNGLSRVNGPISGIYAGFYHISYPLGVKFIGIQSGLEFCQVGYRKDSENYRQQNYLGIPVSLRIKMGPIYLIGGIEGNVKITEKNVVNGSVVSDKSSFFDAHTHAGVGFKIGSFSIEGRYHQGLVDINKGNKTDYLQLGGTFTF
ncbi:MAG: hypothetical protein GC180_03820 [Bacteroidetes bacterium]|nr:hypothetical protein [Bacteroidota bacterium]